MSEILVNLIPLTQTLNAVSKNHPACYFHLLRHLKVAMSLIFPLDKQRAAFRHHLDEPRNQRVIFSGAFGIGKTYLKWIGSEWISNLDQLCVPARICQRQINDN